MEFNQLLRRRSKSLCIVDAQEESQFTSLRNKYSEKFHTQDLVSTSTSSESHEKPHKVCLRKFHILIFFFLILRHRSVSSAVSSVRSHEYPDSRQYVACPLAPFFSFHAHLLALPVALHRPVAASRATAPPELSRTADLPPLQAPLHEQQV